MRFYRNLAVLSIIFFCACSEEDIDETPVNPQPEPQENVILKGKFIDSPVQGLTYSTPTRDGVTNSAGEFEYLQGEMVTFQIGNIVLGSANGNSKITPLEIASSTNASLQTQEVKNICAFLQTLDSDKNAENGISISQEAIDFLPDNQIDFRSNIIEFLGNLVLEVNRNTLADLNVVMPEEATVHLANTIQESYARQGLSAGPFYNIIESWETTSRNVTWVHIYDEENRIKESNAYEKYPSIHILKYEYSEYNSSGYPTYYTSNHINRNDGSDGFLNYHYFEYGENAEILSWKFGYMLNGSPVSGRRINEVDEKGQVLKATFFEEDGAGDPDSYVKYGYYDNGKQKFEHIYDTGATEPRMKREWTYEEFGEMRSQKSFFGTNLNSERFREYQYRDNYTLEKQVVNENSGTNPDSKEIYFYNEQEWIVRHEKYRSDFLYEVTESDYETGITKRTYINEDDNSFYIEFSNSDEGHYKTEYYDSDGNLISTETP